MTGLLKENINRIKILEKHFCFETDICKYDSESSFLNTVASALNLGFDMIKFSPSNINSKDFLKTSIKIKELCEEFSATFIIGSRADIAFLSEADGVLLNNNDIDIHSARKILGENSIIGTYSNDINFENHCADYIEVAISTPKIIIKNTNKPIFCKIDNINQYKHEIAIGINKFVISDKNLLPKQIGNIISDIKLSLS